MSIESFWRFVLRNKFRLLGLPLFIFVIQVTHALRSNFHEFDIFITFTDESYNITSNIVKQLSSKSIQAKYFPKSVREFNVQAQSDNQFVISVKDQNSEIINKLKTDLIQQYESFYALERKNIKSRCKTSLEEMISRIEAYVTNPSSPYFHRFDEALETRSSDCVGIFHQASQLFNLKFSDDEKNNKNELNKLRTLLKGDLLRLDSLPSPEYKANIGQPVYRNNWPLELARAVVNFITSFILICSATYFYRSLRGSLN